MNDCSSKRISKPTAAFTEYLASKEKKVKVVVPTVRKLNLKRLHLEHEAKVGNAKKGKVSRWKVYGRKILYGLAVLREKPGQHLTKDRRNKILEAKINILKTFQMMSKENEGHRSFPEVYESASSEDEKNDVIDIKNYRCSKCGIDSSNNNDLLLCDHENCFKAYHRSCLNPPIPSTVAFVDLSEIWFCWQCESIDNNLNLVNSDMNTNDSDWKRLFPEVEDRSFIL